MRNTYAGSQFDLCITDSLKPFEMSYKPFSKSRPYMFLMPNGLLHSILATCTIYITTKVFNFSRHVSIVIIVNIINIL